NTGCTASDSVTITQINCTIFSGLDKTVCINTPAFDLTGNPTGGTWSGTGITSASSGTFNPSIAGIGVHAITYQVGVSTDDILITVTALPTITIPDTTVCNNANNINLIATPTGGNWTSGTGLINSSGLYNTILGGGVGAAQKATYEYTDSNGCKNSDSLNIIIQAPIAISAGADDFICISANTYELTNGTPSGGTWTGPGIIANTSQIDLNVAGLGIHTYTYSLGTGTCLVVDEMKLNVTNDVSIILEDTVSICQSTTDFQLPTASPAGGVWEGAGITDAVNGKFTTTVTGINNTAGDYYVRYVYEKGTACEVKDSIKVTVINNPKSTLLASVNANGDTLTFCQSNSTELLNSSFNYLSSTNLSTGMVINWAATGGSTNLINANTGEIGKNNPGIGSYVLTLTDTVTSCFINKNSFVNITEEREATITVNKNELCATDALLIYTTNVQPGDVLELYSGGTDSDSLVATKTANSNFETFSITNISNALIRDQDSIYVKIANASCEKKSNSMKLTIHPLPALTLAITSPNTCAKSDIVITASATTLPATSHAYKFEISALGIIQDSTLSTFKFNAQNENSIFVETDYIDINGCKRTAYETVIVNELPDIDFSNDDLNGDSTICSDSPISFTGAINNLVDADLYTFKVNNLVVQSDGFEDVYLTDSLRENSKVKLIILTDEQCQDSVFVNIKVDTIPQLDIILSDALVASAIIPSGNAECQGGSVMFKDVLLQGSNYIFSNFIVNGTDTIHPNTLNQVIYPLSNGTANAFNTIQLRVATLGGCIGEVTDSLFIKPLPQAPISLFAGDSLRICSRDIVNLQFQNASNPINTEYYWNVTNFGAIGLSMGDTLKGDSTFVVPINLSSTVNTAMVSAYSLLDGCISADTLGYTIQVKPKPVMGNLPDKVFCAQDTFNVSPFSVSLANSTVQWFRDNLSSANLGAANGIGNIPNFVIPGFTTSSEITNYSSFAELEGCFSDTVSFEVLINAIPDKPNLYTPNGASFCENDSVFITTEDLAGANGSKYVWGNIDNGTTVETSINKIAIASVGNYFVRIENGDCISNPSDTILLKELDNVSIITDPADNSRAYFENFESATTWTDSEAWTTGQAELSTPSDWNIAPPSGSYIQSLPYTTDVTPNSKVWITSGNGTSHSDGQQSWVLSPCFDFTGLPDTSEVMPVFAASIFMDALKGVNGMSLQVKGADNKWRTIGRRESRILGENWYEDGNNISSEPGGNANGWTSYYSSHENEWQLIRYPLAELAEEKGIRFRFTFSSTNLFSNSIDEGAAFDNIWIGASYKPTLVEQFVDWTGTTANIMELDELYDELDLASNDSYNNRVYAQYHLDDAIYSDIKTNQGELNSRALFYNYDVFNLGEMKTRLNGNFKEGLTDYFLEEYTYGANSDSLQSLLSDAPFSKLKKITIERLKSSLEPALFAISPIEIYPDQNNSYTFYTEINARDTSLLPLESNRVTSIDSALNNDKIVIRAMIVEKAIFDVNSGETLRNVVREMLPNHAGTLYNGGSKNLWLPWTPNAGLNLNNTDIIVYLQHIDTKEVYTSRMGSQVFVSTKEVLKEEINRISIFPNPAQNYFDVNLETELDEEAQWNIYDLKGQLIKSGVVPQGIVKLRYGAEDLPGGVYIYTINTSKGQLPAQKIVIVK
ncbi:MAG: T9SS type A sorting domain-containing protein, partial [Saprospiraceae bacterium]